MPRLASLATASLLLVCGCQVLGGFEDFEATAESASPLACAALPEAKDDARGLAVMARVDIPAGACVWMDRTEVTVAQYQSWLDETAGQPIIWEPTWCRWKGDRSDPAADPSDECASSVVRFDLQPFAARKPMRCVDFCDAEAYCRWAGKRLCYDDSALGIQGPRGYPREWLLACSNGLTTVYPWGNAASENGCNTDQSADACITENPTCGPNAAGQGVECTNQRAIQDLIGNLAEWTFSCTFVDPARPQAPSGCLTRGGAYDDSLRACDHEHNVPGDARLPDLGFRCCADLTASEELTLSR